MNGLDGILQSMPLVESIENTNKSIEKIGNTDVTTFKETLTKAMKTQDDKALKASCDELEAYMLSMVCKQIKTSLFPKDEERLIQQGDYVEMFSDRMIDALSEQAVAGGGIGLSNEIYRQIKKNNP